MTKDEAIKFLLKVMKSPISMTSKSTKEKAHQLANEHGITTVELLTELENMVWKV
jgi:chemotaxis response regulator CheB